MAILRRDDWLTTPQGQALAGAEVYYLTQPADTGVFPPTPLATVYSSIEGAPGDNPQQTDGYGHAVAYLANTQLYTVAFYHPLLGAAPLILPDQSITGGSGGPPFTPFADVPTGTIDGTNKVFSIPRVLSQATVWLNFPLIPGLGYTIAAGGPGMIITYAQAPRPASGLNPGDAIYVQGY